MSYSDSLQAFSPGFFGVLDLETSGRVLLPPQALDVIYSRNDRAPDVLIFCIFNHKTKQRVFAGVKEFTAEHGKICMPYWMMEKIGISEGDIVRVNTTSLPTGTSATFQPTDGKFLEISNTKVVLEHALRQHPCLTQDSIIPIDFAKNRYFLKVLKTEPKEGIYTLKADIVCDFAPPETEFTHCWNEDDTDSSDAEGAVKVHKGYTTRGKQVTVTDKVKILHSTFETREKARMMPGAIEGVVKFEKGSVVAPPKPHEDVMRKREKEAAAKAKLFPGMAHSLKSKSKASLNSPSVDSISSMNSGIPSDDEEKPKKEEKPRFIGQGHTLRGRTVQGDAPIEKDEKDKEKEKDEKPIFAGTGRIINGKSVVVEQKKEEAKTSYMARRRRRHRSRLSRAKHIL